MVSSDDSPEFYNAFAVGRARTAGRNTIGVVFKKSDFLGLRPSYTMLMYIALAKLGMGDGVAVEIVQQSHYNLVRWDAPCMKGFIEKQFPGATLSTCSPSTTMLGCRQC